MILDGFKFGPLNVWTYDTNRDGPKGLDTISNYAGNKTLNIDGNEFSICLMRGENYVRWWTKGSIELKGDFYTSPGTWFIRVVFEILNSIEQLTKTKFEKLEISPNYDDPKKRGRTEERPVPTKILWFSRHELTENQKLNLIPTYGYYEIEKVDKQVANVSEISDVISRSDVLAIVAPINIQQQFLAVADGKDVIQVKTRREWKDGNKCEFVFDGWQIIKKIEVVTEDL